MNNRKYTLAMLLLVGVVLIISLFSLWVDAQQKSSCPNADRAVQLLEGIKNTRTNSRETKIEITDLAKTYFPINTPRYEVLCALKYVGFEFYPQPPKKGIKVEDAKELIASKDEDSLIKKLTGFGDEYRIIIEFNHDNVSMITGFIFYKAL